MIRAPLNEIIEFTLGKNSTRIKEQECDLYGPEDFEKDLHSVNTIQENQGCVISLIKSKASPMSLETKNKCITSNFLVCKFDSSVLDPWYFCYQFNEGSDLEQQITAQYQGINLSVKRLNVRLVGGLLISLPELEKQKKMGELYRQSIIHKDLLYKRADTINQFVLETIKRLEENR